MPKVEDILAQMRQNPKGIHFNDLCKVCDHYFGQARQAGSSHRVYKPRGKAIQELTFKTIKEWQKHIK